MSKLPTRNCADCRHFNVATMNGFPVSVSCIMRHKLRVYRDPDPHKDYQYKRRCLDYVEFRKGGAK